MNQPNNQLQVTNSPNQMTLTSHFEDDITEARIELWRNTYCKGASPLELAQFVEICKRTRLSPETRQIYAIKRFDSQLGREIMQTQTSIDGFRVIAERSNVYAGQEGPYWCGDDGQWTDVWLSDKPPVAAKVGVLRKDFLQPVWGVAKFSSYAARNKQGQVMGLWAKMPDTMTAKCAEALALRRAFPNDLSGLYTREEMAQADIIDVEHEPEIKKPEPKKPKAQPAPTAPVVTPTAPVAAKTVERNKKLIDKNNENWVRLISSVLEKRNISNIPRMIELLDGLEWNVENLNKVQEAVKWEQELEGAFG